MATHHEIIARMAYKLGLEHKFTAGIFGPADDQLEHPARRLADSFTAADDNPEAHALIMEQYMRGYRGEPPEWT